VPEFILPTHNRERMLQSAQRVLSSLDELVAWKVTIEPVIVERTLQQNRYLNGVAYKLIGEKTGYERDEIHEYFLGLFFGWREKKVPRKPSNPKGVESAPVRTTTTNETGKRSVLSTEEFWRYVEFLQRFAAEKLYMVIPDPDPSLRRV
jgi:hypothetical protein